MHTVSIILVLLVRCVFFLTVKTVLTSLALKFIQTSCCWRLPLILYVPFSCIC